jgi:hypothetical protein
VNYVLAQLGLGRANAMTGNIPAATEEYKYFFSLWNDADPDTRILRQAKAEYAKLQ